MLLRSIKLLVCVASLYAFPTVSKPSAVVVYPEVSKPYDQVFAQIIDGIEHRLDAYQVVLKPLKKTDDRENLQDWLIAQKPDMIIALGKRGYTFTKSLDKEKNIVIGALPIKPNGISGISLLADPSNLFKALKDLVPHIEKIHVVYSENSEWLIQLAQQRQTELNITLNSVKVSSLKHAAYEYENLLENVDASKEAIWLPLDPVTANEQVILPNLLKKSWDQNLVIFSSKPAHAKRGALFSIFPNHFKLGQQLAAMAISNHTNNKKAQVEPLSSTQLAVNMRTASHLGLKYDNEQKESFYLTFPQ